MVRAAATGLTRSVFSAIVPARHRRRLSRSLRSPRYDLHTHLGKYPSVIFPLYSLLDINQQFAVNRATDLVIEGFPRSGSTFCYYAFLHAQGYRARVAFHLHVPAHVLLAIRLKIPTLVLIRTPRQAIGSAMLREPHISLRAHLQRYLTFYQTLEDHRASFVASTFHDAISDFSRTTDMINFKFGTSFRRFEHTDENFASVEKLLDDHNKRVGGGDLSSYLPNAAKDILKTQIDTSTEPRLLEKCEAIYLSWSQRA